MAKEKNKPTLYIVATPIGNLQDISLRALNILKIVDCIACESPRHSQRLLKFYKIQTNIAPLNKAIQCLENNQDVALISSAGTPGISDPGSRIVSQAYNIGIKVVPIPGPCAAISAASVSGLGVSKFLFLGFAPKKHHRNKFFQVVAKASIPVIFYESKHRILKTLKNLSDFISKRDIIVFQELTKVHETIYSGLITKVIAKLESANASNKLKGEFVIIVAPLQKSMRK